MQSESARMSSAAEAKFRIDAPNSKPRAVKVIAISGGYRLGPADFLNLAQHVGADAGLPKPFRLGELLELAARVLASPAPVAVA